MNLGRIGVWTSPRQGDAGEVAAAAERLGYGTVWLGGSPPARALRKLLEPTQSIVVATGILNVWKHEPQEAAAEFNALDSDRTLLGIGIGHPEATSDYSKPLSTMKTFLDGLDTVPKERMCIAALGPKMLDLAAERTLGTHPYFVHAEHTRFARERVGDGVLVAPEVAVVVDADVDSGRAKAREYAALYLGLSNYTGNLLRFEFTEADIADGGSDRLIDAVIPHGTPEQIAEAVQAHLDAGADHVCIQPIGGDAIADLEALAPALLA
jgi:probable F420-dependent oxidoreductase